MMNTSLFYPLKKTSSLLFPNLSLNHYGVNALIELNTLILHFNFYKILFTIKIYTPFIVGKM